MTQREKVKAILAIQKAKDIIDDGYHNACLNDLTKVSNCLFGELSRANQDKLWAHFEKKQEVGV